MNHKAIFRSTRWEDYSVNVRYKHGRPAKDDGRQGQLFG